ncbi:MAG: SDR family NAD(P)-dependent oxidoreductase, partial [Candidatus Eremiobacteraeota bacterium]|nr:SDR family NAD(P)-dependent oxidoreductase [Candidatus Eremiobacteraeota bacterium]
MAQTDAGRLALVTGAAGGLGRGVALGLARAGYRIAFTFRPGGTPPDETLALVRQHDSDAVAIPSDATRVGEAARVVKIAGERGAVDVFVHVVGPIVVHSFARSTISDYETMVHGNLTSAVVYAFALLPGMRERKFGRLIYFGMNGSHATAPARGMTLYAAAKSGVVAFARSLALEEAQNGITV